MRGASASFAAALRGRPPLERIDAINRYVNANVTFAHDLQEHRVVDQWASAADTLRSGRGDCEDYAIAKMQMLRATGFADRDLYFVIVKDLVRRSDHAVLIIRERGEMLLLDNGTDRISDATRVQDYRPILSYSTGQAWTHGYQRLVKIALEVRR